MRRDELCACAPDIELLPYNIHSTHLGYGSALTAGGDLPPLCPRPSPRLKGPLARRWAYREARLGLGLRLGLANEPSRYMLNAARLASEGTSPSCQQEHRARCVCRPAPCEVCSKLRRVCLARKGWDGAARRHRTSLAMTVLAHIRCQRRVAGSGGAEDAAVGV